MYVPAHFEEQRPEELARVMREHPLGILVLNGPAGLDANHLPFELVGQGPDAVLQGHVARANRLWQEARDGDEALVIFRAGDAYASPNWYPSKHESHQQVPTWNYQVVHVHGRIAIRDDPAFTRGVVARLTRTHEARAGGEKPWKMTDSSREYIDRMVAAIVGIEVRVERVVGKWKLGQNKDARDRASVVGELEARGARTTADAMRGTLGKDP